MKQNGFSQSISDPCVYIQDRKSSVNIVAVYVDDLIIITETPEEMDTIKGSLESNSK